MSSFIYCGYFVLVVINCLTGHVESLYDVEYVRYTQNKKCKIHTFTDREEREEDFVRPSYMPSFVEKIIHRVGLLNKVLLVGVTLLFMKQLPL